MKIVDANVVLRYLLNDTEPLAEIATEILENNEVFVPTEVVAENVYVLEEFYKVKRETIASTLIEFFSM